MVGNARTRRDLIKQALAGTAYVAPAILSAATPAAVSAASPPPPPLPADLALAKRVDNPSPTVGDTVIFTVTIANTGPGTATNVQVTDRLPAGLTFVSATATYDAATGLWSVGTLANGASATLTIRATVALPAPATNTASITHSDQSDPVVGNNTASVTITPVAPTADLALTTAVANPTPNPRNTATFLTTVTNNGPDAATGVAIADPAPAGTVFLTAAPSAGTTYNGAMGLWTVGTLAAGASATLRLTVTLAGPAAVTNRASVMHSDQLDPVVGNNSATATDTPGAVVLLFDAPFGDASLVPPHMCRANVFNLGGNDATNLVVRVSVNSPYAIANPVAPAGTTVVTADPRTVLWTIPLLRPGIFIPDLTFNAPGPPGTLAITQTALDVDEFDSGPGSDVATATVT